MRKGDREQSDRLRDVADRVRTEIIEGGRARQLLGGAPREHDVARLDQVGQTGKVVEGRPEPIAGARFGAPPVNADPAPDLDRRTGCAFGERALIGRHRVDCALHVTEGGEEAIAGALDDLAVGGAHGYGREGVVAGEGFRHPLGVPVPEARAPAMSAITNAREDCGPAIARPERRAARAFRGVARHRHRLSHNRLRAGPDVPRIPHPIISFTGASGSRPRAGSRERGHSLAFRP